MLRHGIPCLISAFFFFNDTATTEIYTLSLHDALPISGPASDSGPTARRRGSPASAACSPPTRSTGCLRPCSARPGRKRSEEHTSELQSQSNLVCRLLLEKKKKHPRPTACTTWHIMSDA